MTLPLPPPLPQSAFQQGPTAFEIETTAFANASRASLGITKEPIEQTFTETSPRYTFGYLGGFGYRSTASNPLLDHPLESQLMSLASTVPDQNNTWMDLYQTLLARLPLELQQRMSIELQMRNPSFIVLKYLLEVSAQFLTIVQTQAKPVDPGSLEAARRLYNLMLPIAALKNSLRVGFEIDHQMREFLDEQGPNYRNFDGFQNLLSQLQEALGLLNEVNASLAVSENGELTPEGKAAADKAATQLLSLSTQFEQKVVTDDLQILPAYARAMASVAMALSLPHTGSAPLFLGLKMATIGLNSETNEAGLLGTHLSNAIDILSQTLSTSMNTGGREFLKMLTTLGLITSIGLTSQVVTHGLSFTPSLPEEEKLTDSTPIYALAPFLSLFMNSSEAGDFWTSSFQTLLILGGLGLTMSLHLLASESDTMPNPLENEAKAHRFFAFSTALSLAMHSDVIGIFYNEAIAISGGDPKAIKLGTPMLTQLTHLLMMLSASRQNEQHSLASLVEGQASLLEKGLVAAEEMSAEMFEKHPEMAVAIRQLQETLNEKNFEGFADTFINLLCDQGDPSSWVKEFDSIRQLTSHLSDIAYSKKNEEPLSGIVHIV